MALTLRIMSFQSQALGAQSVKTFGTQGGSIGRGQGNDWVLPDPEKFVSGVHAQIACHNGVFYLKDLSTNGTFINGSPQPIGNGRDQPLAEGDRLLIGEYDIAVSLDDADRSSMTGPTGFNLGGAASRAGTTESTGPTGPAGQSAPGGSPGFGGQDLGHQVSSDPLDFFADNSKPSAWPPNDPGVQRDDVSALEHFYQPPPVSSSPPGFGPASSGDAPVVIPEDWDKTGFAGAGDEAAAHEADFRAPESQPARDVSPRPPTPFPGGAAQVGPPPAYPPAAAPQTPAPAASSPPYAPGLQPGDHGSGLASILMAAGLDPASAHAAAAAPELPAVLGALLGVVVQGMLDVLKARSEIKSQFRVPMTMMRPVENNPLKFSANAVQALQNLLVARNPAYLGPVEALGEGFQDLKAHQIAMIAGIRAAFDSMVQRFDPDELAARFEKRLKRGSLISIPGKGRYWEMYRDLFEEWTQDADVNFQRLFGENFARAYEEQMRRLTTAGRSR